MRLIKGENLKVKERPNLLSVRAVNKIPVTLKYFDTYNVKNEIALIIPQPTIR